MSFNLDKEIQKARFTLEKKGIPNVKAAVVLNLDVSGSAQGLFNNGTIQRAFQTVVPLAINFDDNQSLQVFTFASGEEYVTEIQPDANAENYPNYIKRNILDNYSVKKWGGTDYAPVIKENLRALGYYGCEEKIVEGKKGGLFGFGSTKATSTTIEKLRKNNDSGFPSFVVTFTDGQNYDQPQITQLLAECEAAGVQAYFLFVGIGNPREFRNIVQLGDKFDNVGFVSIADIEHFVGSDDVYDLLLPEELVQWFSKK